MKRAVALGLGFLLACGGDPADVTPENPEATQTGAASGKNRAPKVSEAMLSPLPPRRGERITVKAQVEDPDGDRVSITYEWFVNRESVLTGSQDYLEGSELGKHDEIYVLVRATDGSAETVFQTAPTRIENGPPQVTSVRIVPEKPSAGDSLLAEVVVEDPDGDPYQVSYVWLVNGEPLPNAVTGTLEEGRVKRGDRVAVRVKARDPDEGPALTCDPVEVANAKPKITSTPNNNISAGALYRYQIEAKDPDGDRPLRYDLAEGPAGMSVDFLDGLLEWRVPEDANGKYDFEISVRDPYGGEARQSYSLELRWVDVPASSGASEDDGDDQDLEDENDEAEEAGDDY